MTTKEQKQLERLRHRVQLLRSYGLPLSQIAEVCDVSYSTLTKMFALEGALDPSSVLVQYMHEGIDAWFTEVREGSNV